MRNITCALMVLLGVVMIVGGVKCISSPVESFATLSAFFGIIIIVSGVSAIVNYAAGHASRSIWNLIAGICGVVLGIFIAGNFHAQIATVMVLTMMIAVWMLVRGVENIHQAYLLKQINRELPDEARNGFWIVLMGLGVLTVVLGLICAANPFFGIISGGVILGVSLLFAGIQSVALAFVIA